MGMITRDESPVAERLLRGIYLFLPVRVPKVRGQYPVVQHTKQVSGENGCLSHNAKKATWRASNVFKLPNCGARGVEHALNEYDAQGSKELFRRRKDRLEYSSASVGWSE